MLVVVVTEPTEMDDRWLLGWRDRRVEQIRVDYQLTFMFSDDTELTIETPASISVGSLKAPGARAVGLVPAAGQVAAALPLLRTSVLSSVAFKSGALRVVFSAGHHLNVQPDDDYEAWTAVGPGSARWVCQPGGGLAVWR